MAEKANIEGGPADGMQTAPGAKFVWLEVVVVKRTERTPGAGLYELRGGRYDYVGGLRAICECGAIFDRAASDGACPLCGHRPEGVAA